MVCMCGRFTLTHSMEELAEEFELPGHVVKSEITPRYNIAPTQTISAILMDVDSTIRTLQRFRWGLVPAWAKDPSIGSRMINARAETLAEKPSFRSAFRARRCLIPADGFYEWKKTNRKKQPYYIQMDDKSLFAFAGLWEHWENADGSVIDSCTIITTGPNALMADLHNRMPVIVARAHYARWLDPATRNPTELQPILQPYPAEKMTAYPVSTFVNHVMNNEATCIERIHP